MTASAATSEPFLFQPGSPTPSPNASQSGDAVLQQARVEISQIVREVAGAAATFDDRREYLRFLSDRVLRALAAHGVVIYQGEPPFETQHRLGELTDRSIPVTGRPAHQRLLEEVAGDRSPVVVPPMPGATDQEVPANPTSCPVALSPIIIDPRSPAPHAILAVYLPPGGNAASQRGCLRFVAQMADLAGEFLRSHRLRQLSHALETQQQLSLTIERMLQCQSTRSVAAMWVDALAEQLPCDQVSLCHWDGSRTKLLAVSHINRIDEHSDQAAEIRNGSQDDLTPDGEIHLSVAPQRWVAAAAANPSLRLVGVSAEPFTLDDSTLEPDYRHRLTRLVLGGQQAWSRAQQIESIPGARLWQRLWHDQPSDTVPSRNKLRRRIGVASAMALTLALLLALPVPVLLPARGVIRPLELDTYRAPEDCVVDRLHIRHGQSVRLGDVLATLSSPSLHERRATLTGRLSVVSQQQQQWKQALVAQQHDSPSVAETYRGMEFEEELAAIQRQLEILDAREAALTLHARRDGVVDAWRLQERLSSKPLVRGESVLSVVARDSTWVVDATLPQNRVSRVIDAMQREVLATKVSTKWSASEVLSATPLRFGPIVTDPVDQTTGVVLRMTLDTPPRLDGQTLVEIPARVALKCGRSPLGWVLTEDISNWLNSRLELFR